MAVTEVVGRPSEQAVASRDAEDGQQIAALVLRIHAKHPTVPLHLIVERVNQKFDELGSANVQAFREVLTERWVRESLRSEPPRRADRLEP